ncbi:MAG: hypothetical protein EOO38_26990 [Cytophagaceae bacterium]|nr:MAG: hypothetical protein EOO38_26990 [Cytophagaceae bacterium]
MARIDRLLQSSSLGLSLVALQIFSPAQAAPQQAKAPSTSVAGDIVVMGTTRARIDRTVKRMTNSNEAQIPRWNSSICIAVRGVLPDQAHSIADTLELNAREVGVVVERGSCSPNVEIFISGQADALASRFLHHQPNMFRDVARYGRPRSRDRAELLSPEPIRWTVGTVRELRLGVASRLSQPSRENKDRLLVIVDLPRCANVTWEQLSAYLTMVVLANPEHTNNGTSGTIMALFNSGMTKEKASGLTDLDHFVPKALYVTEEQVPAGSQRIAMTDFIVRQRDKPTLR